MTFSKRCKINQYLVLSFLHKSKNMSAHIYCTHVGLHYSHYAHICSVEKHYSYFIHKVLIITRMSQTLNTSAALNCSHVLFSYMPTFDINWYHLEMNQVWLLASPLYSDLYDLHSPSNSSWLLMPVRVDVIGSRWRLKGKHYDH